MEDLIKRQAVLDALDDIESEVADGDGFQYAKWRQYFCDLPPAQYETSPKISEILDYLDTTLHPLVSPEHWDVYATLHDMISLLGLERPEIIHCKDCKHHYGHDEDWWTPYCYIHMQNYGRGWRDGDFCSRAERRIDERSDRETSGNQHHP